MMQTRKKIAIPVLLVTGALLLVFSVLPHHHHKFGNLVCFSVDCCEALDYGDHDRSGADHNHSEAECKLQQFFLLVQRGGEEMCGCGHIHGHDHDVTLHLLTDLFYQHIDIADIHTLVTQQRVRTVPYVEPVKSRYAGESQTLRAPPCVIA